MQAQAQNTQVFIEVKRPVKEIFAVFDRFQMEQALVNIIKNSIESIGEKGEIQMIINDAPLRLLVRDNGQGIGEEEAEKLFTPFFSTKTTGQGVGLTLVREILMKHQFQFSLSTKEDGWTVFEILL